MNDASIRWLAVLVSCSVFQGSWCKSGEQATVTTAASQVRHVFIIVLENKNYADTFETSPQDPYLRKTLRPRGALLKQYYGTAHFSLPNYIAMISGQAPTADTANDCKRELSDPLTNYNDVHEQGVAAGGQVVAGGGCIYPAHVLTLADQLAAAGLTWRGYMEDMGNDPRREAATCGHPQVGMGTDNTSAAEPPSAAVPTGDAYTTRHNPFMYFHSIIDSPACKTSVVGLGQLTTDLRHKSTTPNLVFISPNLCHDGHDGDGDEAPETSCVSGEPGGLTSADAFLKRWVPRILSSPAYRSDGLLIITFDEGDAAMNENKTAGNGPEEVRLVFPGELCCHQRPGPNLGAAWPKTMTPIHTDKMIVNVVVNGYGGDLIGALLLSPFLKPGSSSAVPYNHYAFLKSLEDIFQLPEHLGYAADDPATGYHLDTIGNDRSVFMEIPGGPPQAQHPLH